METQDYDWKVGAIHDFKYAGMSYQELATKYGRAKITIQKMLKRMGVERVTPSTNIGGRIKYSDLPVVSHTHKAIGVRLNLYRTLNLKENLTEFSGRIMVNRDTLRRMELGVHDFTLTELGRVAQMLSTLVPDLLTSRKEIHAG